MRLEYEWRVMPEEAEEEKRKDEGTLMSSGREVMWEKGCSPVRISQRTRPKE